MPSIVHQVASQQQYKVSVILQIRNLGPKELSDLSKVVKQKGGKAGACAPTGCPSRKQGSSPEKEAVLAFQKQYRGWLGWGVTHSLKPSCWVWAIIQPLWIHSGSFYMYLPCDPEIPILGVYPREMKAHVHTKT